MAAAVDERLAEQRGVAVAAEEIGWEAAQAQAEGLGGEVAAAHGGTDEEAAQGEDAMELLEAQGGVPADPAVPVGEREGGGGEADGAEDAVAGQEQVAQLRAGMAGGALGMLALDEFVPGAALLVGADEVEAQPLDLVDNRGNEQGSGDGPSEESRQAATAVADGRRERDAAAGVERAQGLEAASELRLAESIGEAEFGAHAVGEGSAMGEALGCEQRRDARQALGTGHCLENAMLLLHVSLRTDPVQFVKSIYG